MSAFGQMDPVQKQAGVQESSDPLLANASHLIWTGYESDPACLQGLDNSKQGQQRKPTEIKVKEAFQQYHWGTFSWLPVFKKKKTSDN